MFILFLLITIRIGTASFEKLLSFSFECVEIIPLPNWGDTCYSLTIWNRRKVTAANSSTATVPDRHVTHMFRCSTCGAGGKQLNRCRLSYSVYFCDEACARNGRSIHFDELACKGLICQSPQISTESDLLTDVSTSVEENKARSANRKRHANASAPSDNCKRIKDEVVTEDNLVRPLLDMNPKFFRKVRAPIVCFLSDESVD